ncbi:hypothetical protein QLX08_006167 [Tetragonisca angustula]|uniref:Uncharacterized protein n=1 Tax=Tetragonisca angustula TaxID=166442 RepID=A0AAW0ZUZ8_9HYME
MAGEDTAEERTNEPGPINEGKEAERRLTKHSCEEMNVGKETEKLKENSGSNHRLMVEIFDALITESANKSRTFLIATGNEIASGCKEKEGNLWETDVLCERGNNMKIFEEKLKRPRLKHTEEIHPRERDWGLERFCVRP